MSRLMGLAWRLLRGGGRRGLLGSGLTVAAVAVSTGLLLFTLAANLAFQGRADRGAWRNPVAATGDAVAVEAVHRDYVDERQITVVDVAALKPGAPAPPGLDRFPAPGEVWLSPALAGLAAELPAARLADRFPGKGGGRIGDRGLVHPEELVVVRGQAPGAPALTAGPAVDGKEDIAPTKISDFTGRRTDDAIGYQILALIASVLMVVPLLVFGGAAARLTVARRDQRLAALRLIGATPGQVVAMTVAEAVITAFGGAVLGTVLYFLLTPLLTGIEIQGGSWFVSDMWPGVLPVLALAAAVPLLVGLSAVVGLRRIVVSPLGVAKRETPPAMRFIRVVALLAVLALVPTLGAGVGIGVIVTVLSLAFLAINLVGPWVVGVLGRVVAATARRPAGLLAGRRMIDDPRAAWRTVSGVALTGFVAGFIGLLSPGADLLSPGNASDLRVSVPPAKVAEITAQARERLSAAGVRAEVTVRGRARAAGPSSRGHDAGPPVLVVSPREHDVASLDRARTALDGLVPGRSATTAADDDRSGFRVLGDIRTGTVVVLTVSFLVAIASAGITAASSILDRRQTYALLRLAGTPLKVLGAARRAETLIPLSVMGGGAIAIGMFCALPFALSVMNVSGLVTLLVCVGIGFAGVVAAGAASTPLLRSVTANPAPRPD
ncbi:FtsX-like permease family protein [Streptosporangium sp. NPDC051022]|uniref:FtsX-like permease family protein n=1 Tax=Streptosporangium sp. NPDC051022 TaxID=3155752 RepID=UPI0034457789